MRRVLVLLVAAVATLIAVAATPSAAHADDGYRWTWTYCDKSSGGNDGLIQSSGGQSKIRYCKVIWQKNIYEGAYWQSVQFQMDDTLTDGYAAIAWAKDHSGAVGTCTTQGRSWCAEGDDWSAYNIYLDGRTASVATFLAWGPSSTGEPAGSTVKVFAYAPSGY